MDGQKRRMIRRLVCYALLGLTPVLVVTTAKEISAMSAIQDTDPTSLTWTTARGRMGAPSETEDFPLMPELPEFRNALPDLAGPDAVASREIVREATWPISDTHNRTIWFQNRNDAWVYLHHFDWKNDLEF